MTSIGWLEARGCRTVRRGALEPWLRHIPRRIRFYVDKIIPISDLQTKAKQYVEQVKETDQPVVITQRGRAAAVLVSYESYEGFLATRDEMSNPDWERRLRRARQESKQGKGMLLDAYLKRRARR